MAVATKEAQPFSSTVSPPGCLMTVGAHTAGLISRTRVTDFPEGSRVASTPELFR